MRTGSLLLCPSGTSNTYHPVERTFRENLDRTGIIQDSLLEVARQWYVLARQWYVKSNHENPVRTSRFSMVVRVARLFSIINAWKKEKQEYVYIRYIRLSLLEMACHTYHHPFLPGRTYTFCFTKDVPPTYQGVPHAHQTSKRRGRTYTFPSKKDVPPSRVPNLEPVKDEGENFHSLVGATLSRASRLRAPLRLPSTPTSGEEKRERRPFSMPGKRRGVRP